MEPKIKKSFVPLPKSEIVRFSNQFTSEFLTDEKNRIIDIPIDAIRILFKIASDLRNSQFQNTQPKQLDLFNQHFLTEHNSFALFEINFNEILINQNTTRGKRALEFLANFKRGWYSMKNKDGKTIKSYGGLISSPSYSKGRATFLVSSYWLSRLSYLPQYNNVLYRLAFNISSNKHIFFYFWLATIPDQGTVVNYQTINERYRLNYPNAKEICKNFLKRIKLNLDKYSSKSFNYSYKGEQIHIIPYELSNIAVKEDKTKKQLVISQKTHYWRIRHKLSDVQKKAIATVLKNDKSSIHLLEKAYKLLVTEARKKGEKATDYTGDDFIKVFQDNIKRCYQESKAFEISPKGHPKIL